MGRSPRFSVHSLRLVALSAPTNDHGQQDVGALEAVLRHERTPQTYITFLACTDDLASVNYLSHWDKTMPNLDVIDDYQSERAEILRTRGANFPFSYGDYIVKSLLGSSDPWSVVLPSFEIMGEDLLRICIVGLILWMTAFEYRQTNGIRTKQFQSILSFSFTYKHIYMYQSYPIFFMSTNTIFSLIYTYLIWMKSESECLKI